MNRRSGRNLALTLLVFLISNTGFPPGTRAEPPMRFGEVRIVGNKKTRDYVIRREIPVRRGEVYDKARVAEARSRLAEVPGVGRSEIRLVYVPADSALRLDVRVTEKRTFRAAPLIRRGYENIYSFGLWLADDNFRGRGEALDLAVLLRGNTVVRGRWENPWLGQGPRVGIGVDARYRDYRYVYNDLGGVFEDGRIRRGDIKLSFLYSFRRNFRVFLNTGYEQVEGDVDGITVKPGGDRYATVFAGTRYDGRGSRLFPWSGAYVRAEAGVYGPGDAAYAIAAGRLDARVFVPVRNRVVLGARASASVKDGDTIPVYLREHVGGGLTLRGYDFGAFNGTNAMLAGAEFRIPVNFNRERTVEDKTLSASVHLFADAGVAWEPDQSPDPGRWHGGFGGGVHLLNSWVQGIRIDYGWHGGEGGSTGRVHVEIGAMF
jgi:outer membrane protein insertion porin family